MKAYDEGEVKLKDHDHITGKYRGSAYQKCNLNLSLSKKIADSFHNLQNYGSHLIFREVGKYNLKVNIKLKTLEKYLIFTIKQHKK